VSGYAVVQKIFSIVMLAQFFVVPLWPAYGEALARSDLAWARRTLNRALGYSVLLTASLSLPFLFFGRRIVAIWTGIDYAPSFSLLLGFSILSVLLVVAWNLSSLLVHGANLRGQLFFYTVGSLVALLLKGAFAVWFGTTGVVWGTILGFGLIYTPLALRLAYRTLNPP
jgi:O-antigen/teichoic acid export membrane protein